MILLGLHDVLKFYRHRNINMCDIRIAKRLLELRQVVFFITPLINALHVNIFGQSDGAPLP